MNYLFFWNVQWDQKKIFFQIKDIHLIRLFMLKGSTIVHSLKMADIIIVSSRKSCLSWKEISLWDLHFLLTEKEKKLYYSWRIQLQYQPSPHENCFLLSSYMVIIHPVKKKFSIYTYEKIPFLHEKIYTKPIVLSQPFLNVIQRGDSLIIRLTDRKQIIINKHIHVIRNINSIFLKHRSINKRDPIIEIRE